MPVTITLLPWESRVSGGYGHLELTIHGDQIGVKKSTGSVDTKANGWFAIYESDVFAVFQIPDANDCQVGLLIADKIWRLTTDVQLSSSRSLTQRVFLLDTKSTSIAFKYQRLWWNLLHKPTEVLTRVVLVDDWWGVVCDLPGWVASRWTAGSLAEELMEGLRKIGPSNA